MTTYTGREFWQEAGVTWPLAPLRRIATLGTGHTPSRSHPEYWENCTIPWVTTEDLSRRTDYGLSPLMETRQLISKVGLDNSAAVLHPIETVMLSRTASVGHVVRIGRPMATTQAFVTWSCGDSMDPRYLVLVLKAMAPEFQRIAYGSTHLTIYMPDIEQLRVPVPPLRVQRAIADHLEGQTARIDALIVKKEALSVALDSRWRRELLQSLRVADEPALSPNEWIGDPLPDGWSVTPLRRLIERSWGGDWGGDPGTGTRDLDCVRAADFEFRELRAVRGAPRAFEASSLRSRVLRPGDLVLEKSGGGEEVPVGRVVAWRGDHEAVPTNFAAGLRPAQDMDPDFVLLAFRAAYEIGLPWRSIKQTTGLQNLDLGHYLTHLWPLPPRETQSRLGVELMDSLQRVRQLQAELADQLRLLREHRQAMVTAAVTGELEIPGVA